MGGERTDESALVERLRRGEEEAFLHLVRQLHGSLQRFVRRFVASEATAEEIAQETWLAMLQALPRFAHRASLKSWIFSIAANLARSRAAREARTVLFDDLAAATDEEEPAVDPSRFDAAGYWHLPPRPWDNLSPERLLFSQEMRALFQHALESLPPAQQAVLLLRDVEGFSSQEVCNILGISDTNQRVLLHRARSRLRRALEPHLSGGSQQGEASR